jgi:D-alanyl-D-alanine carboxypeptidase
MKKNSLLALSLCLLFSGCSSLHSVKKESDEKQTQTNDTEKEESQNIQEQDDTAEKEESASEKEEQSEEVLAFMEQNPEYDYDSALLAVTMHLNEEPYTNIEVISDTDSLDFLVNKYYQLPDNYTPADLTDIVSSGENGTVQMRAVAAQAFNALSEAAAAQGFTLNACSAFRSQSYQANLWSNGASNYGQEYADRYWTRPGHSEHQTGLSVDVRINNDTSDLDAVRNYPQAYSWLLENMADYGFILRYPEDKEDVTQIAYESWHLRYVGADLAHYITDNGLTLEEYTALKELGKIS